MVLFNICPETAEQQGPFKVKLCPALALKVFFFFLNAERHCLNGVLNHPGWDLQISPVLLTVYV